MKNILTLLGCLFAFNLTSLGAQSFQSTLGAPGQQRASWSEATPDRGFILSGHHDPENGLGASSVLLKFSSDGLREWQKIYSAATGDLFIHKVIVSSEGYFIVGYQEIGGKQRGFISLLDVVGNEIWTKYVPLPSGSQLTNVLETSDGGLAILGFTNPSTPYDLLLVKLDSSLNQEWAKTYSTNIHSNWGRSFLESSDGHLLVSSATFIGFYYDFLFQKIDMSDGSVLFAKTYGSYYDDGISAISFLPDGNILVGGNTWSFQNGQNHDGLLGKISPDGTVLWWQRLGELGKNHRIIGVSPFQDSMFICATSTNYWDGETSNIFIGDASSGEIKYYKNLKNFNDRNESLIRVSVTSDEDIVGVGAIQMADGTTDINLIKLENQTDELCSELPPFVFNSPISLNEQYLQYSTIKDLPLMENTNLVVQGLDWRPVPICIGTISNQSEIAEAKSFGKIYPNPTSGNFTLEFPNALPERGQLLIFDSNGRLVHQEILAKAVQVHTINSNLPSGIYSVSVLDGQQETLFSVTLEIR